MAGNSRVDETEYQNLHLRFFRDLTEGERLRILVELDAVPNENMDHFTHETESKLFRNIAKMNRFDQLREKVEEALTKRKTNKDNQ